MVAPLEFTVSRDDYLTLGGHETAIRTVPDVLETGANDVLVIRGKREHLVPFVQGQYVKNVDLENGLMEVDWDPDF